MTDLRAGIVTAALDTNWTVRRNPDLGCWQVVTTGGAVIADMVLDEQYARQIADDHNQTLRQQP